MSQNTLNIPDSNGATFLTNLNAALQAMATNQSGGTAPSTTYAFQLWVDTSTLSPILRIRNAANSAHISTGLRMDAPNLGLQDPFGWDPGTTSGLNYGYKTGVVLNSSQVPAIIAAGTVALTASQTNYVERTTDGTVSANTTGWTAGRCPMAVVTTGVSTVTAVVDWRVSSVPASAEVIHREVVAYYESVIATTDKQPVLRMPVPRTLQRIDYYKDNAVANVGTTTIVLYKNGVAAYTWTISAALANQAMTNITTTPISFAAGDVLSWGVTGIGSTPPSNLSIVCDFAEANR
jgi:hypothetical protein